MTTCICGSTFTGTSCPTCAITRAVDQAREENSANASQLENLIWNARIEAQDNMAKITARQEHAIANAGELQAKPKAERAQELYAAEMYEEASAEALAAIELDRGNIRAFEIATLALEGEGKHEESLRYLQSQVKLLRLASHEGAKAEFGRLLGATSTNPALQDEVMAIIYDRLSRWTYDDALMQVFDTVRERRNAADAERFVREVIQSLVQSGIEWSPGVYDFIRRKLYDFAEDFARAFLNRKATLSRHIDLMEVGYHRSEEQQIPTEELREFIARFPWEERKGLLQDLAQIEKRGEWKICQPIFEAARAEILRTYRGKWLPKIEREMRERAERLSPEIGVKVSNVVGLAFLAFMLGIFGTEFVINFRAAMVGAGEPTVGGGRLVSTIVFVSVVIFLVMLWRYKKDLKTRRIRETQNIYNACREHEVAVSAILLARDVGSGMNSARNAEQ